MKRVGEILEEINNIIINITGSFDLIIKKREQYEKIKEEFYEAIYGKKQKQYAIKIIIKIKQLTKFN